MRTRIIRNGMGFYKVQYYKRVLNKKLFSKSITWEWKDIGVGFHSNKFFETFEIAEGVRDWFIKQKIKGEDFPDNWEEVIKEYYDD